jgi:hypothetical protein
VNEKDLEAFERWSDQEIGKILPHHENQIITVSPITLQTWERQAWKAACEYKQEEIKDIISFQNTEIIHLTKKIDDQDEEYSKDVGYLDEKIRKLQAENIKLKQLKKWVGEK